MKMKGTLMNKTKMLCAHRTGGVRVNGAAKRAVLMLALAVSAASVAEARDFIVEGRDGAAIQRAIDAAAAAGGGRVVVPAGVYPSGSIRLRSKIDLHLEKGAVFDNVSSGEETTFNRPEKAWGSWETQY